MRCTTFFQLLLSLLVLQTVDSAPANSEVAHHGKAPAHAPGPSKNKADVPIGGVGTGPWFVIYTNQPGPGGPPRAEDVIGFNVVALSFIMSDSSVDKAFEWEMLDASRRQLMIDQYHARGLKVIVSLFGGTDHPVTWRGLDPWSFATRVAKWVKDNGVDGVDIDFEDLDAFNSGDGRGEQFVTALTRALRQYLPQGQYILSHSPQAPWFSPQFRGGGYRRVHNEVGDTIDFYAIQYYNQGWAEQYNSCNALIYGSNFPGSSIMELMKSGIPGNKLVIRKPATPANAYSGYMPPQTIAQCVAEAKNQGWNGGIMTWQYPDADSNWIRTARGSAFL